jgi:enoyl-CoA hydratase/carnithine racemase
MDRITVTMDAGVADVRLVRTDKMNALDDGMFSALLETAERLAADPSVRAVVLSGEGRAFCAGLDASNFGKMAGGGGAAPAGTRTLAPRTHGIANRAQHTCLAWRQIPAPVIAAVHGVAFGGGFQLALGADIRYVAPDTKMSVMEIKWGLVPDMAGTVLMRTLAREDVVRELTYTGRIFTGAEALTLGFATRVCDDPRAEALSVARDIANKNPDAIRAAKRLMNLAVDGSDAALLQAESVEQDVLIGSPNQVEAVKSNLEKRAPVFADARR